MSDHTCRFQVTWPGGPPSPYLTLKSWGREDGLGASGPGPDWSLGACHAEGAGTLGRLQGCLPRRESTGAITAPVPAPSLVTRGPCGCSDTPSWGSGGVLRPSLFQLSWVLLYLVLVSPVFTVGERRGIVGTGLCILFLV